MIVIRSNTVEDSSGPFRLQVNSYWAGCASLLLWLLEKNAASRRF